MLSYKNVILGSLAALTLIGCGGTNTTPSLSQTATTQNGQSLSVRMTDLSGDESYSNEEAVKRDFDTLTLPKFVNNDYQLPTEGFKAGSDINWSLLNSGDFNLTNAKLMIEDKTVKQYAKLSAFINYDLNTSTPEANKTKEFCVTILPEAITPMQKVDQDIQMLEGNHFPILIDFNSTTPYQDCGLDIPAPNGSNITWTVCDKDLLEINTTLNELRVLHPELITERTCTSIKGTFTNGDITKEAYFPVIILPQHKMMSYEEACDLIKGALENLQNTTFDLASILPQNDGDINIQWISCDPELLSIDAAGALINNNTTGTTKEVVIKATLSLKNIQKEFCVTLQVPTV